MTRPRPTPGTSAPQTGISPEEKAHIARAGALAICLSANKSTLVSGDTGEGKTSVIRSIAKFYGMGYTETYPGLHDPADYGGYPVPDVDAGAVKFLPPHWVLKHAQQPGKASNPSILVLEELSSAPPAVLFACMRIALEGVIGDYQMDPATRVVGLMNPPEIAANGTEIPIPLANRFTHIEKWELPDEVYARGLINGFQAPVIPRPEEAIVAGQIAAAKALGAGFVHAKPGSLRRNVETHSLERDGFGFPSPRSWTSALELYGWAQAADASPDVIEVLLTGTIGQSAAVEFMAFAAASDLPDPEAVLANPSIFEPRRDRADVVYAVCASVLGVLARNNTPERWVAAGDVLGRVASLGFQDVTFVFAREWAGDDLYKHRGQVAPSKAAMEGLRPILVEMGRLPK